MKINKEELKHALEIVKPGLANKEIIEQSTSFAFVNGCVVTYNDEISISHPITDLDITGAIKAEELYKFLAKIKNEEIDITKNEKQEIVLKAGKAISGFTLIEEIKLPLDEEISVKNKWFKLPEKFIEFLKFAVMGCSSDASDPKLICVHINKNGFIESCDNLRIIHCKLDNELPIDTCLIPATSINTLIKANPTKVSEGNGWVHFRTKEGTIISCRTFKETFVDTSKYLKNIKGKKIVFPKSLNEVLDKAIIFTNKEQGIVDTIDIEISENIITIKSKSDSSWFREKIKIHYTGEPIVFSIKASMLKDIVAYTDECILNKNILYFQTEDWTYLTTLSIKEQ